MQIERNHILYFTHNIKDEAPVVINQNDKNEHHAIVIDQFGRDTIEAADLCVKYLADDNNSNNKIAIKKHLIDLLKSSKPPQNFDADISYKIVNSAIKSLLNIETDNLPPMIKGSAEYLAHNANLRDKLRFFVITNKLLMLDDNEKETKDLFKQQSLVFNNLMEHIIGNSFSIDRAVQLDKMVKLALPQYNKQDKIIADIGGGTGIYSAFISGQVRAKAKGYCLNIDIDPEMEEFGNVIKKYDLRFRFVNYRTVKSPVDCALEEQEADLVLAMYVHTLQFNKYDVNNRNLQLLSNAEQWLHGIHKGLKDGGTLLIIDHVLSHIEPPEYVAKLVSSCGFKCRIIKDINKTTNIPATSYAIAATKVSMK